MEITIQTKTQMVHNGQTVELMVYKGKAVNSHMFSAEQNFLLKCRKGLKLKELAIDQFVDLVFNKISSYCSVKYNSFEERELFAAELIEMLLKNYPDKYANEVVGGYYLADKKRLTDENLSIIELFRMVDYRQCSNIIHAFDRYFKKTFELELKNITV